VTIAVRPLPRAHADVTLCAHLGSLTGDVAALGEPAGTGTTAPDRSLSGRLSVAYLGTSARSWWSRAGAILDRLALGRAASGRWIVAPIVAFTLAAIALAARALTRELS
jgi:hypothetical protein